MRKLPCIVMFSCYVITGCAFGPNYQRPEILMPPTHRGQIGAPEATSLADLPWWEVFHDDVLEGLIKEALGNNYDLRTAAARVEQARALVGIARAAFFPQIVYQGTAGRAHSMPQSRVSIVPGQTENTFSGVFDMAWEFDVWGGFAAPMRRPSPTCLRAKSFGVVSC